MNADGTRNSITNPAKKGSAIAFFGTGGGFTDPPGVTGGIWPLTPLEKLTQPVIVHIGGLDAAVLYAGSAPGQVSGIFQINVRVPDSTSFGSSLVVTVGGVSSPQFGTHVFVD